MSKFDEELEQTKTALRESIKTTLSASFNELVEEVKDNKYGENSDDDSDDDQTDGDDTGGDDDGDGDKTKTTQDDE